MEPILYWYPVVYLDEDDPEEHLILREHGTIVLHQFDKEPYEAVIEARGSCFYLIFGRKKDGMFLCIPDWKVGCEITELSDHGWNLDALLKTERLDYEESTAIVWALSNIGCLLRLRQ